MRSSISALDATSKMQIVREGERKAPERLLLSSIPGDGYGEFTRFELRTLI